ncbi:PQQ-dependent sugar dehydrogenase [Nocardioides caldifontis]|uniref:PQQ-dependent sugar dehydrogenase n=1 Tax=Nocardioides caldifontis TaxID=2588938 RepID=UPI0011DFB7D9|nr:PQQ-dependent sugar dehydrogenase [Nocardioides caldifontis]
MLDRRILLTTSAAGAATLVVPSPAEAAPRPGKVLARGLQIPWGLAFLPNGDALVTEREGDVHRVRRRGGRRRIGSVATPGGGEGGLLGAALHPAFKRNRWVYFYVTTANDNRVVRRRFVGGQLEGRQVVLGGIPKGQIHDGGRIAFGPDGLLYVATGDTGNGELAQRRGSLAGKILRMTPRGGVPSGNPFGTLVWSYGHRNVQGLDWDRRGRLWATELGQSTRDELNRIRPGRNYGWPDVEGGDGSGPYADPFVTWSPTSSCSPSGLAIAKGHAWVGALAGESLYSVRLTGRNAGRKRRHLHGRFGRIRTVQQAPDGSLWITTSNGSNDKVIRIRL